MKLTIVKYTDKVKLIKFLRDPHFSYLRAGDSLQQALYIVNNLPHVFTDLCKNDCDKIQDQIKNCAVSVANLEEWDYHYNDDFGRQYTPPKEFLEAQEWFETLTEEHKNHINEIVKWKSGGHPSA